MNKIESSAVSLLSTQCTCFHHLDMSKTDKTAAHKYISVAFVSCLLPDANHASTIHHRADFYLTVQTRIENTSVTYQDQKTLKSNPRVKKKKINYHYRTWLKIFSQFNCIFIPTFFYGWTALLHPRSNKSLLLHYGNKLSLLMRHLLQTKIYHWSFSCNAPRRNVTERFPLFLLMSRLLPPAPECLMWRPAVSDGAHLCQRDGPLPAHQGLVWTGYLGNAVHLPAR